MKKYINKWKKGLQKLGVSFYAFITIVLVNMNGVWADVKFNQAKAKSDIKNLIEPLSDLIIWSTVPFAILALGMAYLHYVGQDQETKEEKPYWKYAKMEIFAVVLYFFATVAVKWWSVS